jgi:hypothetical protein
MLLDEDFLFFLAGFAVGLLLATTGLLDCFLLTAVIPGSKKKLK